MPPPLRDVEAADPTRLRRHHARLCQWTTFLFIYYYAIDATLAPDTRTMLIFFFALRVNIIAARASGAAFAMMLRYC